MRRKKTRLICQFPGCGDEYDALRSDSKYCIKKGKRHRTAAWRSRLSKKLKPYSLNVFNDRDGQLIILIKRDFVIYLSVLKEFDEAGVAYYSGLKTLHDKLASVIQKCIDMKKETLSINPQIVWIWSEIIPFLEKVILEHVNDTEQLFDFKIPVEIMSGIERLISAKEIS